jgi:protein-disulfide isomerase
MLSGVSRNRLLLLGGAVGVAALVVVVLILVGAGSDSKSDNTVSTASAAAPQEKPFLAGVPQHGDTLGAADAPATLTVYEDPQCPFCRDWALGTLPSVVADYVRPGRVKLVYRGVQIIGPNSQEGLRAIYAAGRQNKLWNLADALYRRQGAENSGWITDAVISEAAASVGANGAAIKAAAPTAAVTAELTTAARQASIDGVQGTPTFVLQRPPSLPQQLNVTALDPATFESALAAALQ